MNIDDSSQKPRYINAEFSFEPYTESDSDPFPGVRVDTWYYGADGWQENTGTMSLGMGPLFATSGVGAFVVEHVRAIVDAFQGFLRFTTMGVTFKRDLTDVITSGYRFAIPSVPDQWHEIESKLQQSPHGFIHISAQYDMLATVRDTQGEFVDTWLPLAGWVFFHCAYSDGRIKGPGVAAIYRLVPSVTQGYAPWSVRFACDYHSIFQRSNAAVLQRDRESYDTRRAARKPFPAEKEHLEDIEKSGVVALRVPPPGTPEDNVAIAQRNLPRLERAIARWSAALGVPFQWGRNFQEEE